MLVLTPRWADVTQLMFLSVNQRWWQLPRFPQMSAEDEKMERSLRELLSTGVAGLLPVNWARHFREKRPVLLWAFTNGGHKWMFVNSRIPSRGDVSVSTQPDTWLQQQRWRRCFCKHPATDTLPQQWRWRRAHFVAVLSVISVQSTPLCHGPI